MTACGWFDRDLVAELPFILMHPKPEEEPPAGLSPMRRPSRDATTDVPMDQNLIQLDAYVSIGGS